MLIVFLVNTIIPCIFAKYSYLELLEEEYEEVGEVFPPYLTMTGKTTIVLETKVLGTYYYVL